MSEILERKCKSNRFKIGDIIEQPTEYDGYKLVRLVLDFYTVDGFGFYQLKSLSGEKAHTIVFDQGYVESFYYLSEGVAEEHE